MEVSMFRVMRTLSVAAAVVIGGPAVGANAVAQQGSPVAAGQEKPQAKEDAEDSKGAKDEMPVTWDQVMKSWLEVRPIPKGAIIRVDDKYCYPHGYASFLVEIVKEDEDTVWVRGLPPDNPRSPLHKLWIQREANQLEMARVKELLDEHGKVAFYLDFDADIVPPPFMDALRFEPASSGLPSGGLWQMNFALDDMNGDGITDIVLPPTRKGRPRPWIYLGGPDGTFSQWRQVTWSSKVPFDYGGVATGDFDGDGNRDLVLAIHLKAQYVLYGDGEGGFERSERLPTPDPRISSRAPAVADFDGDGRDDIVFIAELDYDLSTSERIGDAAPVWLVYNRGGSWKVDDEGMPRGVIGDAITAADVDGDGRPDLILGSNAANYRGLVFLNTEEGWQRPSALGVLSNAFHYDVGYLPTDAGPQMYWTFVQFKVVNGENVARTGVIPYQLTDNGLQTPTGPVFFDDQRYDPVFRVAVGDLTGDGRPDLVVGRKNGSLKVFVQTESGLFYEERSPEIEAPGRAYHIEIVDIDGDGTNDILASFADEKDQTGGVRVWLTRKSS